MSFFSQPPPQTPSLGSRGVTHASLSDYQVVIPPSQGPLSHLTPASALPRSLRDPNVRAVAFQGGDRRRNRVRRANAPLIRDGATCSRVFNEQASRPLPTLISLENELTATLQFTGTMFTTSVSVPVYVGEYYSLASFADYTQYTTLFDQYKLLQFEAWIEPVAPLGTSTFQQLSSCVDLDDANVPTAIADVTNRAGAITAMGGAGQYHKWVPHEAYALYAGAFTSYGNQPCGWTDCASSGVQAFGLKTAANPTPAAAIPYQRTIRAVVRFRSSGI